MTPAATRATEQIRERADLAAIAGQYVKLRRTGTNYTGLCPFHQEKTPSFSISGDKNLYHCFSCGAGGDVFSFLQRIEGLRFTDARALLADRYGVALTEAPMTREQRAAAARQRAYAEQLAREAAWYWRLVRARYVERRNAMWDGARAAGDDEHAARARYARRGYRWARIVERLDSAAPDALVRRYRRVRERWRGVWLEQEAAWGRVVEAIRG